MLAHPAQFCSRMLSWLAYACSSCSALFPAAPGEGGAAGWGRAKAAAAAGAAQGGGGADWTLAYDIISQIIDNIMYDIQVMYMNYDIIVMIS